MLVYHVPLSRRGVRAGYEHPVDTVVADLLACLDDPALALLQWTEAFNVVQARSHPDRHGWRCAGCLVTALP